MGTLLLALGTGIAFIIAYQTYGRWLGRRVFELAADRVCPSHRLRDDLDYVPTPRSVVFGHHFTSIAGTGPIVGPAIAIMWGWLPALLWVVLGSIFIGAVHDFGALAVSLRHNGQTVGDIAGKVLNGRVRLLFLLILFISLTVVLAIFGLVIAAAFKMYPSAIFPWFIQIPIAMGIGTWLHKKGGKLFIPSAITLALMYVTVIWGDWGVLHAINSTMAGWPAIVWVAILLVYSYVASVLPVWLLLQPRDYINALQLISAMGLILGGLVIAGLFGGVPVGASTARPALEFAAPMVNWNPAGAPAIFPFLFITIACGAISGFHCLVSSGTSSKQLDREPDARFVGYGAMLTEAFLAVLVIMACAAGLGLGLKGAGGETLMGVQAWASRYGAWGTASGLSQTVSAFVDGAGNFLKTLNIPPKVGEALMGVLVASFASTTMDTACRLHRYVIQELATSATSGGARGALQGVKVFQNNHAATMLAVVVSGALAALPKPGVAWTWESAGGGGMILWPLFGAMNQLLGGIAFIVIGMWLWRRQKPVWFLALPMVFMLVMPAWAMVVQLGEWLRPAQGPPNWLLVGMAVATLALEGWMVVEAALLWQRARGIVIAGGGELAEQPVMVEVERIAD